MFLQPNPILSRCSATKIATTGTPWRLLKIPWGKETSLKKGHRPDNGADCVCGSFLLTITREHPCHFRSPTWRTGYSGAELHLSNPSSGMVLPPLLPRISSHALKDHTTTAQPLPCHCCHMVFSIQEKVQNQLHLALVWCSLLAM